MDAVRELNYQPNSSARMLRNRRTNSIAIVVPHLDTIRGTIQVQNMLGVGRRARELDYTIHLCDYAEDAGDLRFVFQKLIREGRFDGVIFFGGPKFPDELRDDIFAQLNIPFVVLEKATAFACIDFDNIHGARTATQHLIDIGRKRIAFLLRYDEDTYAVDRHRGYEVALKQAGIPYDANLVMPARDLSLLPARLATQHLLDSKIDFDAIVCASDEIAMGAIQVLTAAGLRIPEDVAVTGYDDSLLARAANPPLTSVYQDGVEMGRLAVDLLHQQLEAGRRRKIRKTIRPTLVIRRSTDNTAPWVPNPK
jgi:DNA-binding LacI/PurR family transcriptional regulator